MRTVICGMVAATLLSATALGDTARGDKSNERALAVMQRSFTAHGQAHLERLEQDATQAACSRSAPALPPGPVLAQLVKENRESIEPPSDRSYLGDWKRGEAIAQEGTGKQFSDDPAQPSGGNCYACHQLSKQEIAYGTLGPSLYQYGKRRGQSPDLLKFTWGLLYDVKSVSPCSAMPRFGTQHILSEQQLKDVMALLFDPNSSVNQ